MKKVIFVIIAAIFLISCDNKSTSKKENIIKKSEAVIKDDSQKVFLITLDGLRWQELFTGSDSLLINSEFTKEKEPIEKMFWNGSSDVRRKQLMPFFWNTIAVKGQLHGNRNYESNVNLVNKHWFSYPGYNEILCGFSDDERINSNDKNNNPNQTILEKVNNTSAFKGKVGAFGSWDTFPFIINEDRSGVYVNAGYRKAKRDSLTDNEKYLNYLQDQAIQPWSGVRQDVFTHNFALEFVKKKTPKLLYISYGETDDFAHDGDYTHYLLAAKNTDAMIKELWDYCQSNEYYKGKTTFIITTDHGRGTQPLEAWRSHGQNLKYFGKMYNVKGSDETWLAIIGPNISPKGEVKSKEQLFNNQVAATVLEILEVKVDTSKMGASLLKTIK